MNLKQLRYALVLYDTGSFSQAAEVLGISQPSLSQYINKIEKSLDVRLFDRSGSDIRLTDAGKIYLEAGRKILDIERQMQNKFCDLRNNEYGSVVVGISPHRCFCVGPYLVKRFKEKYPGMHLVLDERSGRDLLDSAETGCFDLCLAVLPVDEHIFSYEPVYREEAVIAVPNNTELCRKLNEAAEVMENRKRPAVDIQMINGADFAILADGMPMQIILNNVCRDYGIELNKVVECRSLEALEAMVSAGICSALIPSYLTEYKIKQSAVTCFSIKQDVPSREIVAIYPKGQYLSKPVADLIDILKEINA